MATTNVEVAKKVIGFGSRRVYYPKFVVALMRTPGLSPYHARFSVPLNFSKYDIKDYLYHAYNIKTFNIRSYVKLQPVRDTQFQPRHWFRPESQKYMTVEMERPFVWPADPADWKPWGKEDMERRQKEAREQMQASMEKKKEVARRLKEQAKEMVKRVREKKSLRGWEAARPVKVIKVDEPSYRLRI